MKRYFPFQNIVLRRKRISRVCHALLLVDVDDFLFLLAVTGLPSNVQAMSSDLHLGLKPYSPPGIDTDIASPDKFHPTASGAIPVLFSPSMQRRISAAKANKQRHQFCDVSLLTDGGSHVGIIPLGTGGSLPNKHRNGESRISPCFIYLNWFSVVYVDHDTEVGKHTVGFGRRYLGSTGAKFWFKYRV